MTRALGLAAAALVLAVVSFGIGLEWTKDGSLASLDWKQAVVPGELSRSHAFLSNNCAACHTPVKGVEPVLCIGCHADNTALLQRQPTAFHARIQVCAGCHVEHQAGTRMPTTMDHALLAKIGHRELRAAGLAALDPDAAVTLLDWLPARQRQPSPPGEGGREQEGCAGSAGCSQSEVTVLSRNALGLPPNHPRAASDESMFNCAICHATKDRHQGFFGADCVQCHATTQWTIAEFRHPSPRSTECTQCHKPPPSHNMMHFSMMSAPLARQPNAKVNQCFLCHQTTVWNDIKGVGWIKHH